MNDSHLKSHMPHSHTRFLTHLIIYILKKNYKIEMKIGIIYLLNMHSCLIVNNSSSVHIIINYYKIGVQNQNITRVASKTTCYLTSSISFTFQMSVTIETLSPSDQLLSDGRSPMQHHFLVSLRNTSHYGDEIGCEWHFMLILSCK